MSYFDGNFMNTTSYWDPPPTPNLGTILAMLNQDDKGQNPITEISSQTNLLRDHTNDQPEQRPGLGERITARTGFNIPSLDRENIPPFVAPFMNSIVPSPIVAVSPRFSPSALLQTPNTFSNSLHIMPLASPNTNYKPQETVECFGDATMMISNIELPCQSLQVNLSPPKEASADIAMNESVYIPSHESQVEPLGNHLVASFESQGVDEANIDIISIDEESGDEDEEEEDEGDEDGFSTLVDVVKPSSLKRRKIEISSNMIVATRTNEVPRVIIHMESEEKNPDDGYRWIKYGQKVVKENHNPRSYYKCTFNGCNVKKYVQKEACGVNLVVITYDGIHEHATPVGHGSTNSGSRTQYGSSMSPGQDKKGKNPITEISSQTNLSRDHINDQPEQRPGLGERIAARTGFNIPTLKRENISPSDAPFMNSIFPSPIVAVSPEFSPSALLQTPNVFSNSLQIMPLASPITNYKPQEMVENLDDATMTISNTELPRHPLQANMSSPKEGFANIATNESVNISSHESQVEPLGDPLVDSFESQDVDEATNINIIPIDKEGGDEKEDDEGKKDDFTTIRATRTNEVPKVIIHMESKEKNPDDGYRWKKYGQKVVKENPNLRSYYKCTFDGCNVKKHVQKGTCDGNLVVITYDGIHDHATPAGRGSSNPGSRTQYDSSMCPDHHSSRITRLERPPSSSYNTTSQEMRHFSTFGPTN